MKLQIYSVQTIKVALITKAISVQRDKFPMVPPSFQPFILAISTGITLFLCVLTMHKLNYKEYAVWGSQLIAGCQGHLISFTGQIINLGLEGRQGFHPPETQKILREGFKLFIVSEIMFFASFFGVLFLNKFLLSNHEDTGQRNVDALVAPTINTIILVVSGLFAGQSHGVFAKKQAPVFTKRESQDIGGGLAVAILLGLFFTKLQLDEYATTSIRISDGVFGGVFYVATGFHGIHVLIGSVFLLVMLIRYMLGYLTIEIGYVGFDCAIQYQHFVDAIQIGLYCIIYLQGA